ncbi:GGDEF domain-containing protein [Eubacteriaceae bacterium ES3]|nr:GGDEF domain-containing protein [Eubacteriaceae bacterium ES3]
MKLSKSIFRDLSIYMIGFGVLIGIVFPLFTILFGIDPQIAFSPIFVFACIIAGALVGFVNIFLTKIIVKKQMTVMAEKMEMIKNKFTKAAQGFEVEQCDITSCHLDTSSMDVFGNNAQNFNSLVDTLSITMSAQQLNSLLEKNAISNQALIQIMKSTTAEAGAIFLELDGALSVSASFGLTDPESLSKNKILLSVAADYRSVYLEYPEDMKMDGIITKFQPASACIEPLAFNGSSLGVCLVVSSQKFDEFELDKVRLNLRALSLALHNAIIHEQVQKLAAIDPLTGVLNRRFGMDRLREEYARSARTNIPMGIMMLDLDHFKRINDQYGHLAGDRVLVTFTKQLKELLREGDNLMRYGGEEFIIVLPGASQKDTELIAEKIRRVVNELKVSYGEFQIMVTCSIGYTSIPECQVNSFERLIKKIDEALYFAKESGRNTTKAA